MREREGEGKRERGGGERERERDCKGEEAMGGGGGTQRKLWFLITHTTVKTEGCYHSADIQSRTRR